MEFRELSTFLQVAKLQSFSKAAKVLGYSQAAVTIQIKQLEQELGVHPVSYTHLDVYKRQSLDSLVKLCFTASTEPWTSALMIRGSSFTFPALIWLNRSSRDSFALVSSRSLFLLSEMKVSAKLRASFSLSVATNTSPACGTSFKPKISTGVDLSLIHI